MIITERLILRPFELSDVDDLFEYAKNPNIGKNAGWKPHKTKDESLEIIKELQKIGGEYAIVFKQSNKVIGSIGLHKDSKRAVKNAMSLGYSLSENFWGYGLMPEAVNAMIKYAFEEKHASIIS
ncbi:MAG: GNAT family N-acetyltransferase, partial [Oscillospiraceae bacterium]